MADMVIASKRINRAALAAFLPTQRLIKEFEALSIDVAETIPTSIDEINSSLELAQLAADMAASLAASASAIAQAALAVARGVDEGPPPMPQIALDSDDHLAQICFLREQLAVLTRRVNDLEERPTP